MKFVCENCGKKFDQHEECKNHENSCMTNKTQYIYLKYIMVYPEMDDYDVYIYEHPKAFKVTESYYILNGYADAIYEPEFDTIRITNDEIPKFYIVTESTDLIYEDECIAKLLNHKLSKAKEAYEKFGETIKNFSTTKYAVTRKMI
jgi:hypothetical protein